MRSLTFAIQMAILSITWGTALAPRAGAADASSGSCQSRPKHDYEDDLRIAGIKPAEGKAAAARHYAEAKAGCPKFKNEGLCGNARSKEGSVIFKSCRWKPVSEKASKKSK